ncbi:MAG: hypothetical protein JW849_07435 [Phycisphaerae bacterium]|nr:hypothetical protein [Phycisphaerae bacterium]
MGGGMSNIGLVQKQRQGRLGSRTATQLILSASHIRPMRLVILSNVIELSQAETEEVVQALSFDAADPAFDETIGDGSG